VKTESKNTNEERGNENPLAESKNTKIELKQQRCGMNSQIKKRKAQLTTLIDIIEITATSKPSYNWHKCNDGSHEKAQQAL